MTENKVIKNIVNSALSTCEKNDCKESNCIIKKVEIKITGESEENGLLKNKSLGKTSIKHVNSNIGGRLQFFKDGKFIFELARSNKGEKSGWIPVAKNILENTHAQCRNNSNSNGNCLSQPFIWQRSQKWKQRSPQKYNHANLDVFFKRTENFILSTDGEKLSLKKRRQPLNEISCDKPFKRGDECKEIRNCILGTKLKRKSISAVIQKLFKQPMTLSKNYGQNVSNHFYNSKLKGFQNRQHVSPRKRILKELEKVSLEDVTKRSRAKEIVSFKSDALSENCIQSNSNQNNAKNGTLLKNDKEPNEIHEQSFRTSSKLHSSYSIHSLLGNGKKQINNCRSLQGSYNNLQKVSIKPLELTCSALKYKKTSVKQAGCANDNHVENMAIEKSDRVVSSSKSNKGVLNIETMSPLNYSKYFNMDKIATNIQGISNHHLYQPFSSLFCSTQPFSDVQPSRLQSTSTFDCKSSVEDTENTNRLKKYSNILLEDVEVGKTLDSKLSTQIGSSAQRINTITAPAMLRMYSQNESTGISSPFYMPHMSYYHPYATAAMRHQLWMHYHSEIPSNPIERLSPSLFCLNGFSSYGSLDSVHALPSEQYEERAPLTKNDPSDTPISLCVKDVKPECSSDVPLNLSKH